MGFSRTRQQVWLRELFLHKGNVMRLTVTTTRGSVTPKPSCCGDLQSADGVDEVWRCGAKPRVSDGQMDGARRRGSGAALLVSTLYCLAMFCLWFSSTWRNLVSRPRSWTSIFSTYCRSRWVLWSRTWMDWVMFWTCGGAGTQRGFGGFGTVLVLNPFSFTITLSDASLQWVELKHLLLE